MKLHEIFASTTISEKGCLEWTKSLNNKGYGTVYYNGKQGLVHRVTDQAANGPIPKGLFVLHRCDNPKCINPEHLFVGTAKDNVHDMIAKGRNSKPPANYKGRHTGKMPKGEQMPNSTLTEPVVRNIFALHMAGKNVTFISEATGQKKHVVADICRGRSWRHLDGIPTLEELKRGGVRRGFNQFSDH